jgi:hypothetical protein
MILTLQEWQHTRKSVDDLIIQASSTNCNDEWMPFPIGMSWQYTTLVDKELQIGTHDHLLHCSITHSTDLARRGTQSINRTTILEELSKNGFVNRQTDAEAYFCSLPTYKFVISPEGNGIDCHRHYEALIAGCIPIVEYNPLVELKYRGCPILYTRDYSEITETYLEGVYSEMISREWDFSRLFLSYYDDDTQNTIKECGNFWMNRLVKKNWY